VEKHIVTNYDLDLDQCKTMIGEMSIYIDKLLVDVVGLVSSKNTNLINGIFRTEEEINKLEKKLRSFALNVLSKRQPMADDLRTVLITLKISGILERIADHIVNITKKIDHQIKIPEYFSSKMDLEALGKLVGENFSTVIKLYKEPSNEMAKEVLRKDMLCNELFSEICKKNLDDISKSNEQKECKFFIEINFIAKEFERIGDLVKNISKEVRYSISGKVR